MWWLLASVACATNPLMTVTVDGTLRTAYVHVPDGVAANAPLLLVFHGGGPGGANKGRRMGEFTGFDAVADARGFVVVYPNSVDGNWDDRRVPSEVGGDPTDLAFVGVLVEQIATEHGVDRARVYATGASNGGFFVQRVACEPGARVAGIAPVIAGLPPALRSACAGNPVPVLAIVGTADPLVPFLGGTVAKDRGETLSSDDALAVWATRNGCGTGPSSVPLADADPEDGTTSERQTWPGCAAPTERIVVTGGGHTWPGGVQYLPERWIGPTARDFAASTVIADFFAL